MAMTPKKSCELRLRINQFQRSLAQPPNRTALGRSLIVLVTASVIPWAGGTKKLDRRPSAGRDTRGRWKKLCRRPPAWEGLAAEEVDRLDAFDDLERKDIPLDRELCGSSSSESLSLSVPFDRKPGVDRGEACSGGSRVPSLTQ